VKQCPNENRRREEAASVTKVQQGGNLLPAGTGRRDTGYGMGRG